MIEEPTPGEVIQFYALVYDKEMKVCIFVPVEELTPAQIEGGRQ